MQWNVCGPNAKPGTQNRRVNRHDLLGKVRVASHKSKPDTTGRVLIVIDMVNTARGLKLKSG
jgi:hypothetical protein